MNLPWYQIRRLALLFTLVWLAISTPSFATEDARCEGDQLDYVGMLKPGNGPGAMIDAKGQEYLIAALFFSPSNVKPSRQTIAKFINETKPEFITGKAGPDRYGRLPVYVYSKSAGLPGDGCRRSWLIPGWQLCGPVAKTVCALLHC